MTDWSPFDDPPVAPAGGGNDLAATFHACFRTPAGAAVLDHLRAITVDRVMPAACTDAELRQMEGRRQLFHYIRGLINHAEKD